MAIRTIVTSGFGNGTFDGTVSLAVTRGYATSAAGVVAIWLSQITIINQTPAQRPIINQAPVQIAIVNQVPIEAKIINDAPAQVILINEAPAQKIVNADGDT